MVCHPLFRRVIAARQPYIKNLTVTSRVILAWPGHVGHGIYGTARHGNIWHGPDGKARPGPAIFCHFCMFCCPLQAKRHFFQKRVSTNRFSKNGFPKTGFPKTGFQKPVFQKRVSTNRFSENGFPKTVFPKTGFPKTGFPKIGFPKSHLFNFF